MAVCSGNIVILWAGIDTIRAAACWISEYLLGVKGDRIWCQALETVSLSLSLSAREAPLPSQFKAAGDCIMQSNPTFLRMWVAQSGQAEIPQETIKIFNGGVIRTWLVSVV